MSNFIGNHEITNVTFTKGKSCISIVGPALGSGANGETVALLKSDDVDVSKKIEFITKAMTQLKKGDESIANDLLASLTELKESLEPSTEEVVDPQAEVVEGEPLENTDPNDPGVSTVDVVSGDPSSVTPEAAPVVAADPQPSLVIKSKKEGNKDMTKVVEQTSEEKYEALLKASEQKDAQLEKLLKAEEARTYEACLVKAKGVAHAIGEDAMEPLAKALLAIDGVPAMEPIVKAIEAVANFEQNKEKLDKSAGHGNEGEDDSALTQEDKIEKEYNRLVKATKDAGDAVNFKELLSQAKANIRG